MDAVLAATETTAGTRYALLVVLVSLGVVVVSVVWYALRRRSNETD